MHSSNERPLASRLRATVVCLLATALAGACGEAGSTSDGPTGTAAPNPPVVMPSYDDQGSLIRPADAEEWVFLGSSLNLNYNGPDAPLPADVLSTVLMEPTAYRHFLETGEFREGTMTALLPYIAGTEEPPARGGSFSDTLINFEMSVKDSSRFPRETWAYFAFGPSGTTAAAENPENCHACHEEHARTDHVFAQFYPALR